MSKKRFRVAFSFSGDSRDYVANVAAILSQRFGPSEVFFDKYHEAELARWDLDLYLPRLYYNDSDLVVVVASPAYDKKEWAGLEWTAVRDLLQKRKDGEVMLCRFKGARFQGLGSTAGFVELDHKSPNQAAALILQRLALNEGRPNDYYTTGHSTPTLSQHGIQNNLPRLPHFFGRERELKTIENSLDIDARTWGVLIDGPGGIGKTSLAVRAAELSPPDRFHRILFLSAKESEMSEDGQMRLSDPVLPGYLEMLNGVARLLGQPDLVKSPEDERAGLILRALAPDRTLLILDNLESLRPEHRDQLFRFLSHLPQGCKAIVTSRRRTDIDARIIRLEKLDREAALAYLAELASDYPILRDASEEERIQLYEETGGSPLFIRWVVGQLGKGRCQTIAAALRFLRSAPLHNDPLEFAFGDLLETFTANETKVLAALTYFTGSVKIDHLAELSVLSKRAAETALEDLANRALVTADPEEKAFVLTPLVADFLRKARPEIIAQTGDRLEQRAYALIVENGYRNFDRFRSLDAVWPLVSSALGLFISGPNNRLQTVCDALRYFLEFMGYWDEWLSLTEQAETKAVAAGDHKNAGWRAYWVGWIKYIRRQGDEVLVCADRALEHWKAAQAGARERAFAIRLRGLGSESKKCYADAIEAYNEALDLWRTVSRESEEIAIALNDLAGVQKFSGDQAAAEQNYHEALRVARSVDYVEGVAYISGNLAGLALDQKKWALAETLARDALILSEGVGRQELIAFDHWRLAQALVKSNKLTEARPHAKRAVEIFTKLRSPRLEHALDVLRACDI